MTPDGYSKDRKESFTVRRYIIIPLEASLTRVGASREKRFRRRHGARPRSRLPRSSQDGNRLGSRFHAARARRKAGLRFIRQLGGLN